MNPSKHFAATLAAALLFASPAAADTLSGKVVNSAGVGIAKVRVRISGVTSTIRTDARGLFSAVLPAGSYNVRFEPPATNLAPAELAGVKVAGLTNLGSVKLLPGYTLSGTILDSTNLPLALADINVYDELTRRKLYTPGDKTAVNGAWQVVVPAGNYRVRLRPPSTRLLVSQTMHNVRVSAAVSLGTTKLEAGVLVTGTVVDATTNAPVVDLDVDADDALSGERITTPNDNTNAAGVFTVVVPRGLFHFSFDPPPGPPLQALQRFNVPIQGPTNLGRIALARGFAITGTVKTATGPAPRVNLDVRTVPGDASVYISNDDTDATGAFRVIVPAGLYTVTAEPKFESGLVGARTAQFRVGAPVALAPIVVKAGVVLSGTVRDFGNAAEHDCDVAVVDPTSGAELITDGRVTDATGHYAVVVPNGRWDVLFKPRKASLAADRLVTGVGVAGATTLDARLSLVRVVSYVDTLGIPTVGQNGPILTHLAFVNPTSAVQNAALSLVLIDPDGGRTRLFPPITLGLLPLQFGLLFNLPLPLPTVKAAHLGKFFRLELRFEDPRTNALIDADNFKFIIR